MKAFYKVKIFGTSIFDGKKLHVDLFESASTKEVMELLQDLGLTEVTKRSILKNDQKRFFFDSHRLQKAEDKYFFRVGEFQKDLQVSISRYK